MASDRRDVRDLEDVSGEGWTRTTWCEPTDDSSLVVVRQRLAPDGDQEVVWRVPAPRMPELAGLLGVEPASAADPDAVLAWAGRTPDGVEELVAALDRMAPSVVDGIALS